MQCFITQRASESVFFSFWTLIYLKCKIYCSFLSRPKLKPAKNPLFAVTVFLTAFDLWQTCFLRRRSFKRSFPLRRQNDVHDAHN